MKRLIGIFITIFLFSFGCASTKVTEVEGEYNRLLGVKIGSGAGVVFWHPAFDNPDCQFMNPSQLSYVNAYVGMSYEEFSSFFPTGLSLNDWKLDFPFARYWKMDSSDVYYEWLRNSEYVEKAFLKKFGRRSLSKNHHKAKSILSTMRTIAVQFSFSPSLPSLLFYFIEIQVPDSDNSITVLAQIYDLHGEPTSSHNGGLVPFPSKGKFVHSPRNNQEFFGHAKTIYQLKNIKELERRKIEIQTEMRLKRINEGLMNGREPNEIIKEINQKVEDEKNKRKKGGG